MIAEKLGLPVSECMQRVSHREYKLWVKHLESQWNNPDLVCYYLMQISADIKNLFSKRPVSVNDRKLEFTTPSLKKEKEDSDQSQSLLKSMWIGVVGMKKKNSND